MAELIAFVALCPQCRAELTEAQVKTICASYSSSRRQKRAGWHKGMPRPQRPPKITKGRTK